MLLANCGPSPLVSGHAGGAAGVPVTVHGSDSAFERGGSRFGLSLAVSSPGPGPIMMDLWISVMVEARGQVVSHSQAWGRSRRRIAVPMLPRVWWLS